MTSSEAYKKLNSDPDWICSKRFDYSLSKLLKRYPDGAPTKVIAQALMMSEEDLQLLEQGIIAKIRQKLCIEVD